MGCSAEWRIGIGLATENLSMRLRNSADYRTLLWVAMAAALVAVQFAWPQTVLYALPFSCYLAIACGVIAHNHNHRPTFVGRRANNLFGHVLTIFYGYPTLMWVPTHNLNHHRFVNRPGDATITWRYTNRHNLFVAATYFLVSGYFQSEPIQRYIRHAKLTNRRLYARIMFQYGVWAGFYGLMLALAVALHIREHLGFVVWFCALVLPGLCSIATLMFFNYIQHVHADAGSENDHSRNFTSKTFNFFFFNNGYHTVHHEKPGLHWSALPAAHRQMAHAINPRLNEGSLAWFLLRQYLLAPLIPRLGTRQLGPDPGPLSDVRAAAPLDESPVAVSSPMIREGVAAGVSGPAVAPPSS
jgi:beta-carotene hydroxylase